MVWGDLFRSRAAESMHVATEGIANSRGVYCGGNDAPIVPMKMTEFVIEIVEEEDEMLADSAFLINVYILPTPFRRAWGGYIH